MGQIVFSNEKTGSPFELGASTKLVHTDALAHNVLLQKASNGVKRLIFINWDEGTIPGEMPERQKDEEKSDKKGWIADLMYPNSLRLQTSTLYTRVQLAADLIFLFTRLGPRDIVERGFESSPDCCLANRKFDCCKTAATRC